MMIQIHQKSIPTAQLQHRLVQGESNIEKVVFFVPSVPNVDFSELIFTIKLLAEDAGKIVIGELDTDPTENGILLSWDVAKKYTRYGGSTRLQIDGADATGNIVYRALSEKFCMRKELTGEDAVQDPEPDPEAGYVPPIESGDNGKYLRAMNGSALWGDVDHPKEILWVELKWDGSASPGFDEIVEAVNKGHDAIVYRGIDQIIFRLVRIFDDFAEFEAPLRETKAIHGKVYNTINSKRVMVYADNTYRVYEWEVDIPEKLPNPYALKFSGTAKDTYDGSAPMEIEIPEKLPNPYALNFSGAVSGSYDGSAPMEIEIPIGGSGGGEKEIFWVELDDITEKASHNASEIKDAAAKGYCVIAREGTAAYYDIISVIGSDVGFRTFHTVVVTDANGEQHFKLRIILITVEQDGSYKKHVYLNTEPTLLPNPFPLKFSGAVSGSYDGSSEFNLNIPAIPTIPATLPNPHAMTFSGAVEGTYDGSAPKEIHIPESKEYTLPAASETTLGGVKAPAKTEDMTQPVGIDEDGFLFTAPGGSGGSAPWRLLYDVTTTEDVSSIECTIEPVKEIFVAFQAKLTSDSNSGKTNMIYINGKNVAESSSIFNNNIRAFGFQLQYTGSAAFGTMFENGSSEIWSHRTAVYNAKYLISTMTDTVATSVKVSPDPLYRENKYATGARLIVMGR